MTIVKGSTIGGDEREYNFAIVSAKEGTKIFHNFMPVLFGSLPGDTENISLNLETVTKIIGSLKWELIENAAEKLLKGMSVTINGDVYKADDDGFGDYAQNPLELYTALFWAAKANFPKLIDPLFSTLDGEKGNDQRDDLTPGLQEQPQKTTSKK